MFIGKMRVVSYVQYVYSTGITNYYSWNESTNVCNCKKDMKEDTRKGAKVIAPKLFTVQITVLLYKLT